MITPHHPPRQELRLWNNDLEGSIPAELGKLKRLKVDAHVFVC